MSYPHRMAHSSLSNAVNIFFPNPNMFDPISVRMISDITKNPCRTSTRKSRSAMRNVIVTFKPQPEIQVVLL